MIESGLILLEIRRITSHNVYTAYAEAARYRFFGTSYMLAFPGIAQAGVLLIQTNFLQRFDILSLFYSQTTMQAA